MNRTRMFEISMGLHEFTCPVPAHMSDEVAADQAQVMATAYDVTVWIVHRGERGTPCMAFEPKHAPLEDDITEEQMLDQEQSD